MDNIEKNIEFVLNQIFAAEQKYSRKKGSVHLLAVTKTHPPNIIEKAISAGLTEFGENYLQEALPKIEALGQYHPAWYFIGPVQSNKSRQIAENFDWVLTVDREKTANRLAAARPLERGPLNLCIQVNISGENSKSGVSPSEVYPLAAQIMELPGIKLRGIMGIPAPTNIVDQQRASFRQLKDIFEELIHHGIQADTLSMGMSDDLESAIAEGATMVRIGTAIFGERK